MVLRDADVIKGMSSQAIDEIGQMAEALGLQEGSMVFQQGDLADSFYVLEAGGLSMQVAGLNRAVYHVEQPGAIVGWSSMAGRDNYTASAECIRPTKLFRINCQKLDRLLSRHPADGMLFYKQLSKIVAQRMIVYYQSLVRMAERSGA